MFDATRKFECGGFLRAGCFFATHDLPLYFEFQEPALGLDIVLIFESCMTNTGVSAVLVAQHLFLFVTVLLLL
jgi:hypothetical protein